MNHVVLHHPTPVDVGLGLDLLDFSEGDDVVLPDRVPLEVHPQVLLLEEVRIVAHNVCLRCVRLHLAVHEV